MNFTDVLAVLEQSPTGLSSGELEPDSIAAILVIQLANSDCVAAQKVSKASNATHIALTSGKFEDPNKVDDFFPSILRSAYFPHQRIRLAARLSPRNIALLSGTPTSSATAWRDDHIEVERYSLNEGKNPKLHLCYGDDLDELRALLREDDYLVLIRRAHSTIFDALGFRSTVQLGGKKHLVVRARSSSVSTFAGFAALPRSADSGEIVDDVEETLHQRKNVILFGPPGTGKTRAAFEVARRWEGNHGPNSVVRLTFHPSYGYEEFVQGYRPIEESPSQFRLEPGHLLEAIKQAQSSPVLMVIDEINRADVARVFGELMTGMEVGRRGIPIALAQRPGQRVAIPEELFFLGTMNTADKSVSLLDVALRRRFAFIAVPPDPSVFDDQVWLSNVDGVPIGLLLTKLNERLRRDLGVSPDRAIGHSFLGVSPTSASPTADLLDHLRKDVFPLVQEYAFFEPDRIKSVFGDLVSSDGLSVSRDGLAWDRWLRALVADASQIPVDQTPAGDGSDDNDDE